MEAFATSFILLLTVFIVSALDIGPLKVQLALGAKHSPKKLCDKPKPKPCDQDKPSDQPKLCEGEKQCLHLKRNILKH